MAADPKDKQIPLALLRHRRARARGAGVVLCRRPWRRRDAVAVDAAQEFGEPDRVWPPEV